MKIPQFLRAPNRLSRLAAALAVLLATLLPLARAATTATYDYNPTSGSLSTLPFLGYNFTYSDADWWLVDHAWADSHGTAFAAQLVPGMQDLVVSLAPQVLRYPGGTCVNTINWEDTIGPLNVRRYQPYGINGTASASPYFGPIEGGNLAAAAGAEIVMVVNFNDTLTHAGNDPTGPVVCSAAQSAANYVYYMCGPNTTGTYGALRTLHRSGDATPFNVLAWEIGNELAGTGIKCWPQYPDVGDNPDNGKVIGGASSTAWKTWQQDGGHRFFQQQKAVKSYSWDDADTVVTSAAGQVFNVKFPSIYTVSTMVVRVADNITYTATSSCNSVYTPEPALQNVETFAVTDDAATFAAAGPTDHICLVDPLRGTITFGDNVHGAIPTAGKYVYVDYDSGMHDGYNAIYAAMRQVLTNVGSSAPITLATSGIVSLYQTSTPKPLFEAYEVHGGGSYSSEGQLANGTAGAYTDWNYFQECVGRGYLGYGAIIDSAVTFLTNHSIPTSVMLNASEFAMGGNLYASSTPYNRAIGGGIMYALMFEELARNRPLRSGASYPGFTLMADYLVNSSTSWNSALNAIDMINASGGLSTVPNASATPVVTAPGLAFALLSKYYGNVGLPETVALAGESQSLNWVKPSDITCTGTTTTAGSVPRVVTAASKDAAGNLYLLAINTTGAVTQSVSITVANAFDFTAKPLHSYTLRCTGNAAQPNLGSYNTPATPNKIYLENSDDSTSWYDGQTTDGILDDIHLSSGAGGQIVTFNSAPATVRIIKIENYAGRYHLQNQLADASGNQVIAQAASPATNANVVLANATSSDSLAQWSVNPVSSDPGYFTLANYGAGLPMISAGNASYSNERLGTAGSTSDYARWSFTQVSGRKYKLTNKGAYAASAQVNGSVRVSLTNGYPVIGTNVTQAPISENTNPKTTWIFTQAP